MKASVVPDHINLFRECVCFRKLDNHGSAGSGGRRARSDSFSALQEKRPRVILKYVAP